MNRFLPIILLIWCFQCALFQETRGVRLPRPRPGEIVAATHEEWIELVRHEVDRLQRLPRSVNYEEEEDASRITDLKAHYRSAFDKIQNMASSQDRETTREMYVNGRYIVFMADYTSDRDLNRVMRVLKSYSRKDTNGRFVANHMTAIRHVGKGFTGTLSSSVVNVLRRHPDTYTVERDVVLQRSSYYDEDMDSIERIFAQEEENEDQGLLVHTDSDNKNDKIVGTQSVEWNLDRIDQKNLPLDGHSFNPKGNGNNVDVYVVDTGIRYTHSEFNGRARYTGYDAIDALVSSSSKKGQDCNGHGTHCAATIGGKTFGVAKGVNLYSARVLDCSGTGSVSGIIHAMNYIIKSRKSEGKISTPVFSMSLGVKKSIGFNTAIDRAVKAGAVIVSASGNQRGNSCEYSPGSAALSISVGATDSRDTCASFSNIGSCTDVFAPGYSIHSADSTCDSCTATKSGTSMACPHVAGYAAIILGSNARMSPAEVKKQLIKDSTDGVVHFNDRQYLAVKTPNKFLYVGK